MRVSLVVNLQSTWRSSVFVALAQAVSSVLRTARSAMRRPRHCLVRHDSSTSAMLSQDPCLGVWWIAAPTSQGFGPHEDRAGAAPDVLAVLAGHPPGRGRRSRSGVGEQLQRFLVHDHDGVGRVVGAGVDAQHAFR